MITERDYYNIIETAKDDGREQGRAEGLQAGIEQGSLEAAARIAKAMLADGEPVEKVIRFTGLTREQLERLK